MHWRELVVLLTLLLFHQPGRHYQSLIQVSEMIQQIVVETAGQGGITRRNAYNRSTVAGVMHEIAKLTIEVGIPTKSSKKAQVNRVRVEVEILEASGRRTTYKLLHIIVMAAFRCVA